jgi:translation initiation factor 5A
LQQLPFKFSDSGKFRKILLKKKSAKFSSLKMASDPDQTDTIPASQLKKPGYVMIKGFPCKITELNQKPKATARGNDRLEIIGLHLFTGKKYNDTVNLTAGTGGMVVVPKVEKAEYDVLDVDTRNKTVSVLMESGETKDDLNFPVKDDGSGEPDEVGQKMLELFESGEACRVAVINIMGQERIEAVV